MNSRPISEDVIFKFCKALVVDYRMIVKNLKKMDDELSLDELAIQLMELGRFQFSEVADPTEQDVESMAGYVELMDFANEEEAFFSAFAAGCMLGLVIINEVAQEDYSNALRLIEEFAKKEFRCL
jgi:hypothetical protein